MSKSNGETSTYRELDGKCLTQNNQPYSDYRVYTEEKGRAPSWCDLVPGPPPLALALALKWNMPRLQYCSASNPDPHSHECNDADLTLTLTLVTDSYLK